MMIVFSNKEDRNIHIVLYDSVQCWKTVCLSLLCMEGNQQKLLEDKSQWQ